MTSRIEVMADCFNLQDFRLSDFQVLASVERVVFQSRSVIFHPDRIGPAISEMGGSIGSLPVMGTSLPFF